MDDLRLVKEARTKTIANLRRHINQTGTWQTHVLDLVEELSRDNLILRTGYNQLRTEIAELKRERIVA